MKIIQLAFTLLLYMTCSFAEREYHHEHVGESNIKLNYETLDFENSKKKMNGLRYGIELDHQNEEHHYRVYLEKTNTQTTALLANDLKVYKYAFKYDYSIDRKNHFLLSYINIDDNLVKETDGGHIYGLGYRYKNFTLLQYLSDYSNFDVYQTELKIGMKKKFNDTTLMIGLIEKYIHIKNKNISPFSAKAKHEYFTTGLKLHLDHKDYHASAGTYFGGRAFAVMNDGLKVQHHAMEFKNSYLLDFGKKFDNMMLHLRYVKHDAKEIPIDNHIKVESIALELGYTF